VREIENPISSRKELIRKRTYKKKNSWENKSLKKILKFMDHIVSFYFVNDVELC